MYYLLTAIAALALGPIILHQLRRSPALHAALNGFVLVSIVGLIFLHFLSPAIEQRDYLVIACLVVGFLLPILARQIGARRQFRTDRWGLLLGFAGLAVHAGLDGGTLAAAQASGADLPLALAVILHRLPVGIAVWWLADQTLGRPAAALALISLMASTALGFSLGAAAASQLGAPVLVTLFQGLVGGVLVQAAVHPHAITRPQSGQLANHRRAEGAGALAALMLLAAFAILPGADGHGPDPFLARLFALTVESAPALLLAYLFAGLLSAFVPAASIRWLKRGPPLVQAGRGMLIGLPFPVCSCGVVPLYRTLVAKGAPPAAAMAFLVATPELGIDAILLSIPLLGPDVTLLRLGTAGAAALLVGWWVGGKLKAIAPQPDALSSASVDQRLPARLRSALVTGTSDIVDHTAPWILLGLAGAALVAPWLEGGWLASLPSPVAIILFALIGFPTYVCAASATPLVAALLAAGLSPGAGIAFLITGPATNLSTLGVLASLHGRAAAMAFAGALVAFAVATGIAIDFAFTSLYIPDLGALTDKSPSALQLLCLAGLLVLIGASIARRGIRRFAAEIREGLGWDHDHAHEHGHDHELGHGHSHGHGPSHESNHHHG